MHCTCLQCQTKESTYLWIWWSHTSYMPPTWLPLGETEICAPERDLLQSALSVYGNLGRIFHFQAFFANRFPHKYFINWSKWVEKHFQWLLTLRWLNTRSAPVAECLPAFVLDQRLSDRDRWADVPQRCCCSSRNLPMRGIELQVSQRVKNAHKSIHISCCSGADHRLLDILEPWSSQCVFVCVGRILKLNSLKCMISF